MTVIRNGKSLTPIRNGKTFTGIIRNGVNYAVVADGIILSGNVLNQQDNITPGSIAYSVTGSDGDTGTYDVVFMTEAGYQWPSSLGFSATGKQFNVNNSSTTSLNSDRTELTITTNYEIPNEDFEDNWTFTTNDPVLRLNTGPITYILADGVTTSSETDNYSGLAGGTSNYFAILQAPDGHVFSSTLNTSLTVAGTVTIPLLGGGVTVDLSNHTTIAVTEPVGVSTLSPVSVDLHHPSSIHASATFRGSVDGAGGYATLTNGFDWGYSASNLNNSTIADSTGTGNFSDGVSSLNTNTTVYYRAKSTNPQGTTYGSITSFTTPVSYDDIITSTPTISSDGVITVNTNSLGSVSSITSDESGFDSDNNSFPLTNQTVGREFDVNLLVASGNQNAGDTVVGEYTAIPQPAGLVNINTNPATTFQSSATLNGSINTNGAAATSAGFYYLLQDSSDPAPSSSTIVSNGTQVDATSDLTNGYGNYSEGISYAVSTEQRHLYVVAYGANSNGTEYGSVHEADVAPITIEKPGAVTASSSNIGWQSASISGSVGNFGGSSQATVGVFYSTSSNFGTFNSTLETYSNATKVTSSKVVDDQDNSFTLDLSGLDDNTTYYFTVWASNSAGLGESTQSNFTTFSELDILSVTPSSTTLGFNDVRAFFTARFPSTNLGTVTYDWEDGDSAACRAFLSPTTNNGNTFRSYRSTYSGTSPLSCVVRVTATQTNGNDTKQLVRTSSVTLDN